MSLLVMESKPSFIVHVIVEMVKFATKSILDKILTSCYLIRHTSF